MRKLWIGMLACFCLAGLAGCKRGEVQDGTRVLVVGNSLTYTNNLPAMLTAIAEANGKEMQVDMIVAGGATLSQHLQAGSLERVLGDGDVDVVVFQERGGVLGCYRWTEQLADGCENSRKAHRVLGSLASERQARTVLLGTYQIDERASVDLERNEAETAAAAHIEGVVHVSESFRKGMQRFPNAEWLDEDGMHPGDDLTMLMAIKLYHQIFDSWPAPGHVEVGGVDYAPDDHFVLSGSPSRAENGASAIVRRFGSDHMGILMRIAKESSGGDRRRSP